MKKTPVFPKTLHQLRPKSQRGASAPTPPAAQPAAPVKRDNIFSKSRDVREDRGSRQMKTSHNPQSLPHGH